MSTAPYIGAVMKRRPDIQLAKTELNWEPKTKLKDGLVKTIDWFKNNYDF